MILSLFASVFQPVMVIPFLIAFVLVFVLLLFNKWKHSYWKRRGMPFYEPSILFGNISKPLIDEENYGHYLKKHYDYARSNGIKHLGLYSMWKRAYMPIEPETIKTILVKDFQNFRNRGMYHNEKNDPLNENIFRVDGLKWKTLRAKFTSTFTSGKMKIMFQTLLRVADQLKEAVDDIADRKVPIDVKDLGARFITDVVGSCAFGIDCNSFENPHSEFMDMGQRSLSLTTLETIKANMCHSFPKIGKLLGLSITPQEVTDFFSKVVKETIQYRRNNNVSRNDFLQILLDLKSTEDKNAPALTLDEITAQCFVVFITGFETSSTTINFCLFELAQNQDVQNKVREEIESVLSKHNGKFTYEALAELKFTGQAIEESLRKYPPHAVLIRQCVADYKIPDTDYVIEKDTLVFLPALGLHYDPEYFPDPEKFDPDRFSEENKDKIVPYSYIPFGEGPRNCIGMRFGLMQTKVALAVLLKNFKFTLNEKTELPIVVDPNNFVTDSRNNILLNVQRHRLHTSR